MKKRAVNVDPRTQRRMRALDRYLLMRCACNGYLGGGDEVEISVLVAGHEEVLGELGQLSGAVERLLIHDVWHVHLLVAVLKRVGVEH